MCEQGHYDVQNKKIVQIIVRRGTCFSGTVYTTNKSLKLPGLLETHTKEGLDCGRLVTMSLWAMLRPYSLN